MAPKKWTRMAPGTPASSGDDRRSVRRYTDVQARAWPGWWEGEGFRSTTAQFTDISLRGCMMTVDQLPPAGQPVWFCPPGTTPSDWIEPELIEPKRRLLGPRMVRLSFRNPFLYKTFKNVVYGPAKVDGLAPSATRAPEEGRDYWQSMLKFGLLSYELNSILRREKFFLTLFIHVAIVIASRRFD